MKNRFSVRVISVFLALIFVFSSVVTALAVSENENKYPTVFVDGMAAVPIYIFNSDGTKSAVFPPDEKVVGKVGNALATQLKKLALSHKNTKDAVGDLLISSLNSVFENFGCDANGNVNPDTGVEWDYTKTDYDENLRAYYFAYDWRISMFDIAKQLNSYIELVKKETGKDKVNVRAFSMGGPALMTYISQYGYGSIAGMLLDSTAVLGSNIPGDMLNGKIEFDSQLIVKYLDGMLDGSNVSQLVNSIIQILYETKVLDGVTDSVATVVENYKERLYDEFFMDSFITLPGVWSLVPNSAYSAAKNEFLDSEKNKELIAVNDKYQNEVQLKAASLLEKADKSGIPFGFVSKYNIPLAPCVESGNHQSDDTIDTIFTSFGATCSDIGAKLSDDYSQALHNETNYISPDRIIDASTCLYPEKTWFVKNMPHDTKPNNYLVSLAEFVFSGNKTVKSDSSFPQFSSYDKVSGEVTPLNADENNFKMYSLFELIIRIFKIVITMIFG